jgi:putative effector of murein hydrolase
MRILLTATVVALALPLYCYRNPILSCLRDRSLR